MDFPYKQEFYTASEIWKNAQNTMQTKVVFLHYLNRKNIPRGYVYEFAGKANLALVSDSNCYETNLLTDLFTEEARMQANRKGQICPLDYYRQNKDKLSHLPRQELREHIFQQKLECNNFKITLSQAIYLFFKAKRVLDPSAGWGDRVLGASLANVEHYTGYDPNPALRSGYDRILKFIPQQYELITQDFLKATLATNYDLVFTSPPFFDYEIYCDHEDQSVTGKQTLEQWLLEFFYPYLKKAYDSLVKNGFFVLYMSDTPAGEYMSKIDQHMQEVLGAKFLGLIATGLDGMIENRNFPFWVWQKS